MPNADAEAVVSYRVASATPLTTARSGPFLFNAQGKAERTKHAKDCGELWIAVRVESLVEAFSTESCLAGDSAHAARARDVTQCGRNDGRMAPCQMRTYKQLVAAYMLHHDVEHDTFAIVS